MNFSISVSLQRERLAREHMIAEQNVAYEKSLEVDREKRKRKEQQKLQEEEERQEREVTHTHTYIHSIYNAHIGLSLPPEIVTCMYIVISGPTGCQAEYGECAT